MDNQHRYISGYRELDKTEINEMNEVKTVGNDLGNLLESFKDHPEIDQRWLSIGMTDIQKGLMAVVRSIAKPTTF